jgi:C4-dicarboxylate transporter
MAWPPERSDLHRSLSAGAAALGVLPFVVQWAIVGAAVAYAAVVWFMPLHHAATSVQWPNASALAVSFAMLLYVSRRSNDPTRELAASRL